MIDLNICEHGDKLLTKNDDVLTYCYKSKCPYYPHVLKNRSGQMVTRTDTGQAYAGASNNEGDIIGILTKSPEPVSHDFNGMLKLNIINLVKHHRKHCDGPNCNISLYLIEKLVQKAGIPLTDEEKKLFW